MDKDIAVYPYYGILLGNEKECITDATTGMNFWISVSEKSHTQKTTQVHNSIYKKF